MAFPVTKSTRRALYPPVEARVSGWMPTDSIHEIYYEESGNPHGLPVVVLHGGPGGGVDPGLRRFFDPAIYRIIMFDQRGCGRSRPKASLDQNTTWDLVDDIERLRRLLDIDRWVVFGGSWGSTLSLVYAIRHPGRCVALILRGVFLMTARELRWFYQDGASQIFPDAWERFLAPIPVAERDDLIAAYGRRLTGEDLAVREECALAWARWEGETATVRGPSALPSLFTDPDFALAFARIENWYFTHGGFLQSENWILDHIGEIRHLPCWIAQGRFDMATPLAGAWALHRAWPEAQLEIVGDAGHSASEPGLVDSLIRATDWVARL